MRLNLAHTLACGAGFAVPPAADKIPVAVVVTRRATGLFIEPPRPAFDYKPHFAFIVDHLPRGRLALETFRRAAKISSLRDRALISPAKEFHVGLDADECKVRSLMPSRRGRLRHSRNIRETFLR